MPKPPPDHAHDSECITRALSALEDNLHYQGWNRPALLFIVTAPPQGEIVVHDTRICLPDPVDRHLHQLARILASATPSAQEFVRSLVRHHPHFFALGISFEMNTVRVTRVQAQNLEPHELHRSHSILTRNVVTLDIFAKLNVVLRQRGGEQQIFTANEMGGSAVQSLMTLMRVIAAHLPEDSPADLNALLAHDTPADREAAYRSFRDDPDNGTFFHDGPF